MLLTTLIILTLIVIIYFVRTRSSSENDQPTYAETRFEIIGNTLTQCSEAIEEATTREEQLEIAYKVLSLCDETEELDEHLLDADIRQIRDDARVKIRKFYILVRDKNLAGEFVDLSDTPDKPDKTDNIIYWPK